MKKTPLTWREYVHQCDMAAAAHRRRLEQLVEHGALYTGALIVILWEAALKIT